jgi:putative oxidoreductase
LGKLWQAFLLQRELAFGREIRQTQQVEEVSMQKMIQFIKAGYRLLVRSGVFFQVLLLLFFRLNWGWQFFISGKGKLLDHPSIVEFFTSLNLPYPDFTAWFVSGVECVGGILLLVGLATRPVGVILSINMIVAYLSVEDDRVKVLNFFKDQDPFFAADPFFFLLTALLAFAFGGGPVSCDALIGNYLKAREKKAT